MLTNLHQESARRKRTAPASISLADLEKMAVALKRRPRLSEDLSGLANIALRSIERERWVQAGRLSNRESRPQALVALASAMRRCTSEAA